jgi:polar amino acid transport system permease protein
VNYQFHFDAVAVAWPELLYGCWLTLRITLISLFFALFVALGTVMARTSRFAPSRWFARAFIEFIRNTPFLVQVFFLFFALPAIGLSLTAGTAAILALALNGGAYGAEIIRGGINSIHKGQGEAARALGLAPLQTFRYVVLRPALRVIYPALTSQCTLLLLTSSIVSSISAEELTSIAQRLESNNFRSFEVYLTVTLLYFAIALLLSTMLKAVGRVYFTYPVK